MTCTHLLCELIGGDCSIAVQRSRGCHAAGWANTVGSEVLDEVRALLGVIEPRAGTDRGRAAAVRLAQLVRAEALEERNLLAHAREDDPELADLLAPLVARRARR
ncbi:MAG TPA: hypothetical protein VH143_34100 [Kofleriaceae bacterium]|jgi:hypothetical protein|nr:hypothetical protein [Kofleriaceae bacterium]